MGSETDTVDPVVEDKSVFSDKLGYKTTAILMGLVFAVYTWPIPVYMTSIEMTIFSYPFSLLWVICFGPLIVLVLNYLASRYKWKKEIMITEEDS